MKKSLIVISAAVCIAAACGAYAVLSSTDDKIEMSAKPIQIQAKTEAVQNKDAELYEASINEDNSEKTVDTDNDEQQSSFVRDDSSDILKIASSTKEYYSSHERIRPQFTPVKRIQADLEDVIKSQYEKSTKEVRENFNKKYDIDPKVDEKDMTDEQQNNLGIEYTYNFIDRITELNEKMVEDGYGYEGVLIKGNKDFISDEYILQYCDMNTMICNAYNDPDYEIEDTDRLVLLKGMKYSVSSLNDYLRKHPDNALDEVKETLEYINQTYAAEYGRRPFEG